MNKIHGKSRRKIKHILRNLKYLESKDTLSEPDKLRMNDMEKALNEKKE